MSFKLVVIYDNVVLKNNKKTYWSNMYGFYGNATNNKDICFVDM